MKKWIIGILVLILAACQSEEIALDKAIDIAMDYSSMDASKTSVSQSRKEDDGFYILLEEGGRRAEFRLSKNGEVLMYNDITTDDTVGPSQDETLNAPENDKSLSLADEFNEALNMVLEHFATDRSLISEVQVDQDEHQDGLYDVEFVDEKLEYEAKINILSGEIFKERSERNDDPYVAFKADITWNEAFDIAFSANDIKQEDVYDVSIDEEYWRQTAVMEIDYRFANNEYKVVIDAASGEVLNNEIDN